LQSPTRPADELQRLQALYETALLDSPPEEKFDRLTRLVQRFFAVKTVLISLVDADRQWFKSCQGLEVKETGRDISFCGHTVLERTIFEIPDARQDSRFADNPLVTGAPHIRFYAGAPLSTPTGYRIGSLCLIDPEPRQLTADEREVLRDFADCVEADINVEKEKQLQKALQQSEQYHRLVLAGTRIGTWEWNVATGETVFNERWAEIVGYTLDELAPVNINTWLKLVHPEDAAVSGELLQRHFSGELPFYDCQCRMKHKDGRWVWVHDRGCVTRWAADGSPLEMYGTHADMTAQKNAELLLQLSEARLRGLFELSPLGIALTDYDNGAFIEVNDALLAPTGYTREEFVQLTFWQITPPKYRMQEAIQQQNMLKNGRYGPYEKEYFRKDGSRYPVRLNGLVMQDPSGKKLVWSIVEDISEHRHQQQALEAVNERLTLAADSARFGVWDYDVVNNVLQWDDWMFRLYGVERSSFRTALHAWQRRVHPDDGPHLASVIDLAQQSGKDFRTEFRIVWPDGQIRYIQAVGAVSLDHQGRAIRMTGINYDITESKQAERMKSEFVSTVSHELRTPLTSIAGSLGLIAGGVLGELPEAVKEMVAIAHANSLRLTYLINDLLDMEKLLSGKMRLEMQLLSLLPLVQQSIRDIQGYAGKYQVQVRLTEGAEDAVVVIDPQRAAQVLANYLSNAIKYSPEHGIVDVSVKVCGASIRVTVKDQGPGIPAEFQARIFQKFAQADASDSRRKGGTGLGLAITKALAEQMGGQVGFSAAGGRGAAFYVEWPLASC
jgi:PAS domain S-box-containing protein